MSKHKIDKLDGFVIVTGASSGIGLELARCAAKDGVSLLLVADTDLGEAQSAVRAAGAQDVEAMQCDLGTDEGVEQVIDRIAGRPVAALFANAGHGLGQGFLDEDWDKARHVIDTNVIGTAHLVHAVGRKMRERDEGRILITGSIAGHMPGSFQLAYNSTKAFVDDFAVGLAEELKDSEVVITVLEPGATQTRFFERAGLLNTKVGQDDSKADPAKVAADGYKAMLDGDTEIVSGMMNKLQAMFADFLPDEMVAKIHRRMAQPREAHEA